MSRLDDLLHASQAPMPTRELSPNFTADTLNKLADKPQPRSLFGRLKENFVMKLVNFAQLHRPATIAAIVIGTIVISGTASAATIGWPNVFAIFGGQKNLSDGSRVIQVNTKNCRFITALNVTKPKTSNDYTYYYRVKPGSKLTNAQITQMVQGKCDEDAEAQLDTQALQQITNQPANQNHDIVGGYIDNIITKITSSELAVSITMPDGSAHPTTHYLTFNHFEPNMVVIEKGRQVSLSDLKVGDHVELSYRASGSNLSNSETTPPWAIDPNHASLAIVIKNTANLTAALQFQQHNYHDFEEVTPCTTQPDGYCNIEQLNKK